MVVIDTLEGEGAASRALKALPKELLRRPVEAVIYTHHHDNHILGTPALGIAEGMPVIAQSGFLGSSSAKSSLALLQAPVRPRCSGLSCPLPKDFPTSPHTTFQRPQR